MARVIAEATVQITRLTDVVEDQDTAGDARLAITNRRRRALDIQLVAVAPDQQRRPHRLDRAIAANRNGQRDSRAARRFLRGNPRKISSIGRPLASSTFQPVSSSATGLTYSTLHLGVRRNDAIADRLQGNLRALFFAKQRIFVELALGNIDFDAEQANQPPIARPARIWRGSSSSASRRSGAACDARIRKTGTCPPGARACASARARCHPDARGCTSRARRPRLQGRSRAWSSSGATG